MLDFMLIRTTRLNGLLHCVQERNEVRWRPGQEASLAPPYSNLRRFGGKCTVLMNVLVTSLVATVVL